MGLAFVFTTRLSRPSSTVALSEAGHFTWPDWTQALGAALKERGATRPLDGGQDYYAAWLAALETMLARRGLALPAEVEATRDAWERAYLATPHGQPVKLASAAPGNSRARRRTSAYSAERSGRRTPAI